MCFGRMQKEMGKKEKAEKMLMKLPAKMQHDGMAETRKRALQEIRRGKEQKKNGGGISTEAPRTTRKKSGAKGRLGLQAQMKMDEGKKKGGDFEGKSRAECKRAKGKVEKPDHFVSKIPERTRGEGKKQKRKIRWGHARPCRRPPTQKRLFHARRQKKRGKMGVYGLAS